MSRIAYVDGRFTPLCEPAVGVEDRGFQFADGVYEVWAVRERRLLDLEGHLVRLARSLRELRIPAPMSDRALLAVMQETLRRNRVRDGIVYLQITRGVAPRDHAFPVPAPPATLVVTAKSVPSAGIEKRAREGIAVITVDDVRWGRCDIKSVSLLANVLAKQAAREAGAYEAWLVDADGFVTEGSSTNAWIVDQAGALITRSLNDNILAGVTRARLIALARERQMPLVERAFSVAEAKVAREAFISSASAAAIPVTRIDGAQIADGAPGPVAKALFDAYFQSATEGPGAA
jgi:D-alanine transaminase